MKRPALLPLQTPGREDKRDTPPRISHGGAFGYRSVRALVTRRYEFAGFGSVVASEVTVAGGNHITVP